MITKISSILQWLWRQLPEVRPYTGQSSLRAKEGEQIRVINGKIVVTTVHKNNQALPSKKLNQ